MMLKLVIYFTSFLVFPAHSQIHFAKFRPIRYKEVSVKHETALADTTRFSVIELGSTVTLRDFKILVKEMKDSDSSALFIYKGDKLFQQFVIPYTIWHLDNTAYLADINGDKLVDVKFFMYGTGSGLAGSLSAKIYLFNRPKGFKLVSFFDLSAKQEYDLDGDGNYEILSCNHIYHGGHSYWAYNAFTFNGEKLLNVSKT